MKKTKYFKLFKSFNGQRRTPTLSKTGPGVYVIREGTEIVYVGYSGSDVKKALYRHFQKWIDKRHPENKKMTTIERVSYSKGGKNDVSDFSARVIFTTKYRAAILEEALILKLEPRDNTLKLHTYKIQQYFETLNKYENADDEPPF